VTVQTIRASTLPERPVLMAFAVFILAAGGASVAMRVTFTELAPFWVGASRFALAALVFWILAFIKRLPIPRGRALFGAITFGLLTVGFAFVFAAWGLVATPASLYQTLMAMVPLLTIFLSALHGIEAITPRGIFGSSLAVIGIVITFSGADRTSLSLLHIGAILLAAASIAEGGVLIKRFPPNPPIMTNAIAMTVGAAVQAGVSRLSGEQWVVPTQMSTLVAYIYLVLFVTVLAFLLYMFVLNRWSASGTSYGFVVIPLVTIVIAAVVVGEQITPSFLFGAAFVLAGVFLGALLPSRVKPAEIDECKDRSGQVLPRCA
jgi:drug/metabolite transporter (DMT)-like permease